MNLYSQLGNVNRGEDIAHIRQDAPMCSRNKLSYFFLNVFLCHQNVPSKRLPNMEKTKDFTLIEGKREF